MKITLGCHGNDCLVSSMLLALIIAAVRGAKMAPAEVDDEVAKDYCLSHTFTADCGSSDRLVLMRNARYGRMHLGTCLLTDFGSLDCSVDVIGVIDRRCSGRRSCAFPVPDPLFEELHNQRCRTELKNFLSASYTCITVASALAPQCTASRNLRLTSPSGYISSLTTDETGGICGSESVPWVIEVEPGKRILFTLYDFGLVNGAVGASTAPSHRHLCLHYADLVERGSSQVHKICGGRERVTEVYTSVASTVEVRIVRRKIVEQTGSWQRAKNSEQDSNVQFVIYYETLGCADLEMPSNMWVKRSGDRSTVGCSFNDLHWKIECSRGEWIGNRGNCSQEAFSSGSPEGLTSGILFSLPFEVSLAIIVGLAFVVGVTVFTIGIILLKRGAFSDRDLDTHRMTVADRSMTADSGSLSARTTVTSPSKHGQAFVDQDRPSGQGTVPESDYAYVWDDVPDLRGDPSLHYLHPACQVNTRLSPGDAY